MENISSYGLNRPPQIDLNDLSTHLIPIQSKTNVNFKVNSKAYKLDILRTTIHTPTNIVIKQPFTDKVRTKSEIFVENKIETSQLTKKCMDLVGEDGKLYKQYKRACFCANTIEITKEQKKHTYLCDSKVCKNCNRIRTSKAIKKYSKELSSWKNPVFLTLTRQHVKEVNFKSWIKEFNKMFQKINKLRVWKNHTKKYLRAFEVLQKEDDLLHPHYHLIVENQATAEIIRDCWIKYNLELGTELQGRLAIDPDGQDIRPIYDIERNMKDLLKYVTKLDDIKDLSKFNNILEALNGARRVQAVGFKVEKLEAEQDPINEGYKPTKYTPGYYKFNYKCKEYIEISTGEILTELDDDPDDDIIITDKLIN